MSKRNTVNFFFCSKGSVIGNLHMLFHLYMGCYFLYYSETENIIAWTYLKFFSFLQPHKSWEHMLRKNIHDFVSVSLVRWMINSFGTKQTKT